MNRERMLAEVCDETDQVQYDGNDEERITAICSSFTQAAVGMIEALGKYRDAMAAPLDENSADLMKEARYEVVYSVAMAQAATSKVAWALRIDADEAYKRVLKDPEETDLSGL